MDKKSLCADDFDAINQYSDMVYRMAYSLLKNKYDAEDIHQEVFIRYFKKHPVFQNADHEKAWFLRVTINACKNFLKTAWIQKRVGFDKDFEEENFAENTSEKEESCELILAVKQLPQKYRIVIHLFYYEELSIKEISDLLGISPSTVRTQLTRARAGLKELIKEDLQ